MEHTKLLLDIGELNWVFTDNKSIESLLQKVVAMVSRHMHTDVCSIYLYDEPSRTLTLRATHGLNPASVNHVTLNLGEGLAGATLEQGAALCVNDGFAHPSFKYIPGTDEDRYCVFLAVPIMRGLSRIGVLMVQRREKHFFEDNDISAMRIIASQLANLLENANLLMQMQRHPGKLAAAITPNALAFVKGKTSSPGYAYGRVIIAADETRFSTLEHHTFTHTYTMADFHRSLALTRQQLKSMQAHVEDRLSDAASLIFTAHLLMLNDHHFIAGIEERIAGGDNPPCAIVKSGRKYMDLFLASDAPAIREKAQDVADLVTRVVCNMVCADEPVPKLEHHIVITREIYPSDILRYSSEKVAGIIQIGGGVTSHVSILARSLAIPMVISDELSLLSITGESRVLIDAELGNIYINPHKEVLDQFPDKPWHEKKKPVRPLQSPTRTADCARVALLANINLIRDVATARALRCDGIGLYRTEFPFIIRRDFPSEEEQYVVYRKLVEGMPGKEITFRTLDVGGDKVLSYFHTVKEENPFLGMRSIRFSLNNPGVFRQQLLAILRAGAGAHLKIMFPMISSVDELLRAREVLEECKEILRGRNVPYNDHPRIGMMVEIPSVVNMIDAFAPLVDFLSVGTNDLVQYYLAVDRTNEKVADYYVPHHPSVLRAIKTIASSAAEHGVELSVCGDMASSDTYLEFLIGVGIRRFSMDAVYLPRAQKQIATISAARARTFARTLLRLTTIREIETLLHEKTTSSSSLS